MHLWKVLTLTSYCPPPKGRKCSVTLVAQLNTQSILQSLIPILQKYNLGVKAFVPQIL